MQGTPHLHPTLQSMNVLFLLSQGSWSLLLSRFICQEKRKVRDGKDKLKKRGMVFFYIFWHKILKKIITGSVIPELCNAASPWAQPQPDPLVPVPEHLPPIPSISPSWQMLKYSEQGEIANNRIKVATCKQLCEMEPLSFI